MIQSIHKGKGFRGVLNYVFGREKSPELVGGNMYGEDPRALAQEFAEWRELRPGLTRAVFHSSLSLPHGAAGREELSDAQWRDVAERYLEHLGYGRSPFVVVRHRDTEHDHVHIIAARIGADGRAVSDSHDYRRGEVVLRQLEREYGLTQVKSAHEVDKTAMRPGEIRQLERTGEVSARLRLQDLLDRAAADRPSMSAFLGRLREAGVEAAPRVATTGHVSGISYGLDGTSFRGSALGRAYSWRGLQERLGVDYQPERDLGAVRAALWRVLMRKFAAIGLAVGLVTAFLPDGFAAGAAKAPPAIEGLAQCKKTFQSGSGPSLFKWCFHPNGTLGYLEAPAGSGHLFGEAFGICADSAARSPEGDYDGIVHGLATARSTILSTTGFLPPTFPNATTVVHRTSSGRFEVRQVFSQAPADRSIFIAVTVKNLRPTPISGVLFSRVADFGMDGTAGFDQWFKFGSSVVATQTSTASLSGVTGAIPREAILETSKVVTTCFQDGSAANGVVGDYMARVNYDLGTMAGGSSKTFRYRVAML